MTKFVKVILFLLLAVALRGVTNNVFTEQKVGSKEYAAIYPLTQQDKVSAPEFPYLPIAELTTNLQSHQAFMTRVQRVQIAEYFFSLKNMLQVRADKEASLSQHRRRIYTTTSYYCRPSSEYYVFTLRHIII